LDTANAQTKRKVGWLKILTITAIVAIVTSLITVWIAVKYLFPNAFEPVELSTREEQVLEEKLSTLTPPTHRPSGTEKADQRQTIEKPAKDKVLQPERYSEKNANREIAFTEREINALLAKNTDLARKLAIDLSENLASAKLLVPLDPEFPVLGGKTLKVTAGLDMRYSQQKPVVILRGISIWGVPIPNAWLGGIKTINLVSEFGLQPGFWNTFAAGVEDISIQDGQLSIKLKP